MDHFELYGQTNGQFCTQILIINQNKYLTLFLQLLFYKLQYKLQYVSSYFPY